MKIEIKSGKRGRPLTADVDEMLEQFVWATEKALPRLAEFRRTTKGIRGEQIFGTRTSLPDWATETFELLSAQKELNRPLTYTELKSIKSNIKSLQQLGSKQARVYEKALANQMIEQYFTQLDKFAGTSSKFTQSNVNAIKSKIKSMSARQVVQNLTSSKYQDPATSGRYKRVKEWAKADAGRQRMSYQEAWAYVYASRIERGWEI